MFEVRLFEVISAKDALDKVCGGKLNAVLSRNLGKYLQLVLKESEEYDKIKNDKIREYGEEVDDENGQKQVKVKDELLPKFFEEMNELVVQPVSVNLKKIELDHKFPDIDPKSFNLIQWIFEDDEDDDEDEAA